MSRFKIQHTTQNIVQTDSDERTLLEKAHDQAINKARLTINSDLNIADGYEFIDELAATGDRVARQAVLNKWRAYADVRLALGKLTDMSISQFRLTKAVAKARELGWTIERNRWNVGIDGISWSE